MVYSTCVPFSPVKVAAESSLTSNVNEVSYSRAGVPHLGGGVPCLGFGMPYFQVGVRCLGARVPYLGVGVPYLRVGPHLLGCCYRANLIPSIGSSFHGCSMNMLLVTS